MVTSILPVKATVIVKEGEKVKAGQILVKIPKDAGKTRDITGGYLELLNYLKLETLQIQLLFLKLMVILNMEKLKEVLKKFM